TLGSFFGTSARNCLTRCSTCWAVCWSSAVILTATGAALEVPGLILDAAAITGSSAATANNFKPRRFMYFIYELAFLYFVLNNAMAHEPNSMYVILTNSSAASSVYS